MLGKPTNGRFGGVRVSGGVRGGRCHAQAYTLATTPGCQTAPSGRFYGRSLELEGVKDVTWSGDPFTIAYLCVAKHLRQVNSRHVTKC
jgi:hypothetical protein